MTTSADAVTRLEHSTRTFLEVLDGLADTAWQVRPPGEPWSIAETVEHVVLTNRAIHARTRRLLDAPFPAGAARFDDDAISASMFDAAGPPPPGLAEPEGRFVTRAEGTAALVEVCNALATWGRETAADLRAYGLPHPVFGMFDGVQWLLFAAAHTDNHLPEIRALRAQAAPAR